MPIVDLQRRARELGRIRIGQVVTGPNGKTRPEKLNRFRLTSSSRELLAMVASLYGGEVREWTPQNNGASAWEVVTEAMRLPVLVPPQPVSQWYESWSGGGCQRRCDGVTEVLTDTPCLCGPDPRERVCKPTTRLNVVLSEVEGVGVWRLETHGYYAAVELPSAAELLAASNGYISGHLALEERAVKRAGKTKRFMVPTLEVGVTPAQLMAGNGGIAIEAAPARGIAVPQPAVLPAAPSMTEVEQQMLLRQIGDAHNLGQLRTMWSSVKDVYDMPSDIDQAFRVRAAELADQPATGGDVNALWLQIMQTVPEEWPTSKVEEDFAATVGVSAETAGADEMARYLEHLGVAS